MARRLRSCLVEKLVLKVLLSVCHGERGVICVVFCAPLLLTACATRSAFPRIVLLDYEQISHVQESVRAVLDHPETAKLLFDGGRRDDRWNPRLRERQRQEQVRLHRLSAVPRHARRPALSPSKKSATGSTGSDEIRASCLAQGVLF